MKIKIFEAVEMGKLLEKLSKMPIDVQISYKFAKISLSLKSDIDFYQNQYIKYLKEFGLQNEEGFILNEQKNIKIIPGKEEECRNNFSKLNSIEIEIPDIYFTLDELKGLKFSISDMKILTPFIKEPLRGE